MNENNLDKKNIESYKNIARIYAGDEFSEDDPKMREKVRESFKSKLKGNKILEIGCGPGTDSFFFHKNGLDVTATDACSEFIQIIRERHPEINTQIMNMQKPNLPKKSFDGIYGAFSFLHLPRNKSKSTLIKLKELLKEEGTIFLILAESSKFKEYIIDDWGGKENNPVLFTCYDQEEIKEILEQSGYKNIEFEEVIKSEKYEKIERINEKGLTAYIVSAEV